MTNVQSMQWKNNPTIHRMTDGCVEGTVPSDAMVHRLIVNALCRFLGPRCNLPCSGPEGVNTGQHIVLADIVNALVSQGNAFSTG